MVADDHPVVRDGLRALFEQLPDMELVAEAATGAEAVRAAVTERPDVVIMDLGMPDMDGFDATREISRVAPDVAVLVLTMTEDEQTMSRAVRAGAKGYLLKGATKDEIVRAVNAVSAGEVIFGQSVARHVLSKLTAPDPAVQAFPELTRREREAVDRLARGLSNAAIAADLGISLKTVNNLTSSAFAKLGVASRTEAVIRARDAGLGRA
jgi:DNA-binding NarL/FixJ family response regulator